MRRPAAHFRSVGWNPSNMTLFRQRGISQQLPGKQNALPTET
jgi:hypothetical protein